MVRLVLRNGVWHSIKYSTDPVFYCIGIIQKRLLFVNEFLDRVLKPSEMLDDYIFRRILVVCIFGS